MSREYYILTSLAHRNVIRLLEVLQDERGLYLVMEYADAGSLNSLLEKQPEGAWCREHARHRRGRQRGRSRALAPVRSPSLPPLAPFFLQAN